MATSYSKANVFSRKPYLIALIVTIALIAWMASGSLGTQEEAESTQSTEVATEKVLPSVEVQSFQTQPIYRSLELYGRTEPDRILQLSSEIDGRVETINVSEGQFVKAGELIVQLAENDKREQLKFAKTLVKQREIEFQGAKSLQAKGLQGESLLAQAEAALEEARALVKLRESQLTKTIITAPFSGYVQNQQVELGSIVNKGQVLFHIVDLNPLVVKAHVTENHVNKIDQNANVEVQLVDGSKVAGKVRFISSVSDMGTNTFPLEIEIPNSDNKMKAGASTAVTLTFSPEQAIKVSPALLSLDKDGNMGVKSIENDKVLFTPIDLIKAEQDGVWLGGFSGEIKVITRGQGFVRPGDKVNAVEKQAGQ